MRRLKEIIFVPTAVFICVILVLAGRHHLPNVRNIKEIWHGHVHWESEPNATMLRSVPHVKDHKHIKPYELSEHAEFDLRLTSFMKECSTKQLSECIKPGRLITDWETEKGIIRFFDNSVRNVRRFIYKKPRDPLIYIDKCQHVEYSIDKNKGYTKLTNAKSININWPANRGTKWVYAKCMDNQRSGQPELNHLIYPTAVNKQLKEDRPNVVVLQIDGMSHRQYQSLYTKTQTVLKSLNSRTFSFKNYWANGYNSPPNMKRMYCDDKSCDSSHVLKHFQQAGFETSWILEYTYGLMGYPFSSSGSRYVDKLFAGNYYNKNWKSDLTDMVGGFAWDEYCYMKSLRYLDLFIRDNGLQKNSKTGSHAAIVVPNVAHSSERMRAKQMDNALATLLRDWDRDGLMSNTIFCIVSDHGIHGSPINIFLAGEFEHRNPVFEMIVPKSFLQKHPNVETYLKHNTNAITTHFDFYKSIASLANVQTWRPATGTNKKTTEQKKYNIFMDRIPVTRTCQQAGIPDKWCNCWSKKYTKGDTAIQQTPMVTYPTCNNPDGLGVSISGVNIIFKKKCPYLRSVGNKIVVHQENFWMSSDVDYNITSYNQHYTNPFKKYSSDQLKQWGTDCNKVCTRFKCVTARVSRDTAIKYLLKEWMKITKEFNIMTVNAYGSLIASLHRKSVLMKYDSDVDYLIWAHDSEKLENCMIGYNSRKNNRFRLVVHPDWRCKFKEDGGHWGGRAYYNKQGQPVPNRDGLTHGGLSWVAPNARLYDIKENAIIDIFAMYPGKVADNIKPVEGRSKTKSTTWVNFIKDGYNYADVRRDDIFPLRRCNLEGVATFCPNNGQKVLKSIYGRDVSEPNHKFDNKTGCFVRRL